MENVRVICHSESLLKYVFKLLDSLSDRHIVQIFNSDETRIISTILAIPNYRLRPTGESTFQFWETPVGQPKAMRAWFYPGDNFGQEFAYPKSLSIQIAKTTHTPVPAIADEAVVEVAELKTARVVLVEETGKEIPVARDAAVVTERAIEAAPSPDRNTDAVQERNTETANAASPAKLPDTASPYPFAGLLGAGALAASGLLSFLRKAR